MKRTLMAKKPRQPLPLNKPAIKRRWRVTTATCKLCGDEIYSRARHDFRYCSCGEIYVDGGRDYFRLGYLNNFNRPKIRLRYVTAAVGEMYVDWTLGKNKFGIIAK